MPTKRISGLRPPYSPQFILTIFAYLTASSIHYLLAFCIVDVQHRWVVILPSVLLGIIVAISWACATMTNPESTGMEGRGYYCLGRKVKRETRFCTECRKMVFEIDHHCSFLNNCIGSKNYSAFFMLILSSSAQMLFFILGNALFQVNKRNIQHYKSIITSNAYVLWALVALHLLLSILLAGMLLALLGLHLYLTLFQRLGTYDWLLQRRSKKMAKRKAGYNASPGEEESIYSHASDSMVVKLRQQQREAFEQSLFTGKKGFHDSFGGSLSVLSLPHAHGSFRSSVGGMLGENVVLSDGSIVSGMEDVEMLAGIHRWLSFKEMERQSKGSSGFGSSGILSPASGKSGQSDSSREEMRGSQGVSPVELQACMAEKVPISRKEDEERASADSRVDHVQEGHSSELGEENRQVNLRVALKKVDGTTKSSGIGTRVYPAGDGRIGSEASLSTVQMTASLQAAREREGPNRTREDAMRGSTSTVAYP